MRTWESWERSAEKGPLSLSLKAGCFVVVLLLIFWPISCMMGWFGEAASVVRTEFGPKNLFQRYQWFKDAAAQLDARTASLAVYEARFASLKKDYEGKPRSEWARDDREQSNLWEQEAAGLAASYNNLAAEYNAAMAKVNWRYCNVGDMPEGGQPLPREFKTYLLK